MNNSTTHIQQDFVRAFAQEYPTPNVLLLLAHCEAGRISWADGYRIAARGLSDAVKAVA